MRNWKVIYLITKNQYFEKPKLKNIKMIICKLKLSMILHKIYKLAILSIGTELDKSNWSIIKLIIYSEFQNTNLKVLIWHKNNMHITNNWKSIEYKNVLDITRNFKQNKIINELINNVNENTENDNNAYIVFSKY